jgi:hypothetical protein
MTSASPKTWAVGPGLVLTPISDDEMFGKLPAPEKAYEIYDVELTQLVKKGGYELLEALCSHGCMGESVDEKDLPDTIRVTIFQEDHAEHMCFTTVEGKRLPLTQMDTYESEYYWMRTVFRLLGRDISET